MPFIWKTPHEEHAGVTYSIVYLPHDIIRLRITGSGDIPGIDKIRPWTSYHYSLDEIWIGEGIRSIGAKAFIRNPRLKQVWLPDTLTDIGVGAFDQCPDLEIIVYEGSMQELQKVNIPAGAIPNWFDLDGGDQQ